MKDIDYFKEKLNDIIPGGCACCIYTVVKEEISIIKLSIKNRGFATNEEVEKIHNLVAILNKEVPGDEEHYQYLGYKWNGISGADSEQDRIEIKYKSN